MKEKILTGALIQFITAGVIGISVSLLKSFEAMADIEFFGRLMTVCFILGLTGTFTGLIGAVYPKKTLVPKDVELKEV